MPLPSLKNWSATRHSLHVYSKLLGAIRAALSEPHPLWWHTSLRVENAGFGTGLLELENGANVALSLDLESHRMAMIADGKTRSLADLRQAPSGRELGERVLAALSEIGAPPKTDRAKWDDKSDQTYRVEDAASYRRALTATSALFERFRRDLDGDRAPVQLWPHHFDLSFEWFSDRTVSDGKAETTTQSRAQIGFGLSPGDDNHTEAYYYGTPWPFDEELLETDLPGEARWLTEPWKGALLPYAAVAETGGEKLVRFAAAVYQAARPLLAG